jgi:thioredoxin-like negative regulator of GroEL
MRRHTTLCFVSILVLILTCGFVLPKYSHAQSGSAEFQTSMKAAAKLAQSGNFDDAVTEYRHAIQLSGGKDYAPYWGLAQAYNQLNDTKNVLATCDQMLALATNDATRSLCHNLKGLALAKKGVDDKATLAQAEAEFRKTIDLDSSYAVAYFNLGTTLLLENHDAEGVAELKAYLKALPDGVDSDEAEALIADPGSARRKPVSAAPSAEDGAAVGSGDSDDSAAPADEGDGAKVKALRFTEGPLPSMELTTLKKEKLLTRSLRGKVVLLAFWATKCELCDQAFPELQRINSENANKKFVLVSINEDDNEKLWRDSVDKSHPAWTQAWDQHGFAMQQLFAGDQVPMPCYFVIDGNGMMHQFFAGWGSTQRRRIQSAINQWLAALPAK